MQKMSSNSIIFQVTLDVIDIEFPQDNETHRQCHHFNKPVPTSKNAFFCYMWSNNSFEKGKCETK